MLTFLECGEAMLLHYDRAIAANLYALLSTDPGFKQVALQLSVEELAHGHAFALQLRGAREAAGAKLGMEPF